jgi:hypothetical protein
MDEFIKLLKAEGERIGRKGRVYSVLYGAQDTAVLEMEFETIEEQKEFFADYNAQTETVEFSSKLDELRESGTTMELLILH